MNITVLEQIGSDWQLFKSFIRGLHKQCGRHARHRSMWTDVTEAEVLQRPGRWV